MGVISDELAQTDAPDASSDNRTGTPDDSRDGQARDPFLQDYDTDRFAVDRETFMEGLQFVLTVSHVISS
jgi:hypothetical protein